jgi:integrase/recombinase XerD
VSASPDARTIESLLAAHLEWLAVSGYSPHTVANRRACMAKFLAWCQDRNLLRIVQLKRTVLQRYQRHLYYYRKEKGEPLSFRTQHGLLVMVRVFFKWLCRNGHLLANPAADLELPRYEHRLPRHVLTAAQTERLMAQPVLSHPMGVRDRAILEVFYSTGMRRGELAGLRLYDIDRDRGTVMIRQGKGKKDRVVPIGLRALQWLDRYVREARPGLAGGIEDGPIFLTEGGAPINAALLSSIVSKHVREAGLAKRGACHLLRHTAATLMLEGGADIRFIQQMLGHAQLSSTQIYTQVSIAKLKAVHAATHPAGGDAGAECTNRGAKDAPG